MGWHELNYILNEGTKVSGKTVAHTHMLIFTRKENDGISSMRRPTAQTVSDEHLANLKKSFL
jgi:diadenosine tetraphosphate (Ap4A) HIT family hydrolase